MNDRIRQILEQINALEDELRTQLHEKESQWLYKIRGRRIEFESGIREMHRRLKMGVFRWLATARPQNYQLTCFPIYRIARVRRCDYIVFDQRHLAYLNWIEKIDCLYCSYGNGLMSYAREIFARTEQYFCPIKHARQVRGVHERYAQFLDYGDANDLHDRFEELRLELLKERKSGAVVPDSVPHD
jgi:hypothetical protein